MRNVQVLIAASHKEAELWDFKQQMEMTPHERISAACELIGRVFGRSCPAIRDTRAVKIEPMK
jgi:hypothetical protein